MIVRLSLHDQLRTALIGARSRPLRTALSALGVAVGVAALTAITGVAASNQAQLLADLDTLGANLIVVSPGYGPDNEPVPLPPTAPEMIERIDHVEQVGVLKRMPESTYVYRNDLVPEGQTNGLRVYAATPEFLTAVEGSVREGVWLDEGSRRLPVAVLGAAAAARLGISEVGVRVWIGAQWYVVIGILNSAGLAEQLDSAAFLGDDWARDHAVTSREDDTIDSVFVRVAPGQVAAVREVIANAANPLSPYVQVSELSDLANAREATSSSLSGLVVALAAISVLVGGIGIANTMIVAVLERRGEIGLRRALGARAGQIASQFIGEAILLGGLGGVIGAVGGAIGVFVYAAVRSQVAVVPLEVMLGGPLVALVVGVIAGLYPALSAARLSPTIALRTV